MSGAGAFWLTIGLFVVGFFVVAIIKGVSDANIMSTGTPQQKADLVERNAKWAHGELRSQVVCPHCQERGRSGTRRSRTRRASPAARPPVPS